MTNKSLFVGFEVLTAVVMGSSIFCYMTPCSTLKNRRFGGIYRFHRQGRIISKVGNQHKAGNKQNLLFEPEDGVDMILRNGSSLSTDYATLYSRRLFGELIY
jgi:hypothetical protein